MPPKLNYHNTTQVSCYTGGVVTSSHRLQITQTELPQPHTGYMVCSLTVPCTIRFIVCIVLHSNFNDMLLFSIARRRSCAYLYVLVGTNDCIKYLSLFKSLTTIKSLFFKLDTAFKQGISSISDFSQVDDFFLIIDHHKI